MILAAHGEAETAGFFENFRVGQRTLAHSAEVMHLPAALRWLICILGALRKRLANRPGSPHNALTRVQASALAERLAEVLNEPVSVRVAFASSDPSVEMLIAESGSALQRMLISMSPSDSRLSCGLLCHALQRAASRPEQTRVLARLWDDPAFAALNADHVRAVCKPRSEGEAPSAAVRSALLLVFHGTLVQDQSGLAPGFHNGQAEKSHFAAALHALLAPASESPWAEVSCAYLNHDVAGRWSEPTVAAALEDLHGRGIERVWVFPCDFLVEGGEIIGSLSTTLDTGPIPDTRLLPCLNASPALIDYLARRIKRALDDPQGQWQCDACPRASG